MARKIHKYIVDSSSDYLIGRRCLSVNISVFDGCNIAFANPRTARAFRRRHPSAPLLEIILPHYQRPNRRYLRMRVHTYAIVEELEN